MLLTKKFLLPPLFLSLCVSTFLLFSSSTIIFAKDITPFYSRNLSPFLVIFGLPRAESGTLTPVRRIETRLVGEVINHFTRDRRTEQLLIMDGETYLTTLLLRWGIEKNLEIGIEIPYLIHDPGLLDTFIEDWHTVFGFSNKKRQEVKKDQLNYSLRYKERQLIGIREREAGIGDIRLSFAFPILFEKKIKRLSIRTGLKIPTGNPAALHGSGNVDLSLGVYGLSDSFSYLIPLRIYGSGGFLFIGPGREVKSQQRTQVGFGSVGIGGPIFPWLEIKTQLDAHTPFYNNASEQLGAFSAQLLMGGTLKLPNQLFLDIAVSEDVIKDTAPDLLFHFALSRQF